MNTPRPFPVYVVLAVLMLSGCVARTVFDVATVPVRAAGKAVDLSTTSQSESDQNRGRALRHREERLAKLEREYRRESARCRHGDHEACAKARNKYAEIRKLLPAVSAERR